MRDALRKAGRAWYFLASQKRKGQFNIIGCQDVPGFLEESVYQLKALGEINIQTFDIEGCFPNMPKADIKTAMDEIINFYKNIGEQGVWVPHAGKHKCSFKFCNNKSVCEKCKSIIKQ